MNIKYFAICECCNFKALSKTKWEIHLKSQKHLRNGKSKIENYVCEICGYWCMHIFNLNAHRIVRHGLYEQKNKQNFIASVVIKLFMLNYFMIFISTQKTIKRCYKENNS